MLRTLMLKMAASPRLVRLMAALGRRYGLVERFIAGETVAEAMKVVRRLNDDDIWVTLDLLGEGVMDGSEAGRAAQAYASLLADIDANRVRSSISIKLTQLGLDVGVQECSRNLRGILDEAQRLGNFVRIDMEGSAYTQATLDIFREYRGEFGDHLGIVIQAYLRRSRADIEELAAAGCNIRLCKGAYMEPPEIAFPAKKDVDDNFRRLLEIMLDSTAYSAIATHDEAMIEHARSIVESKRIDPARYEFQMLYGVRRQRQLELRRQGCKMRVYVPFGTQWAPYFMRRLAERPANVLFMAKSLVKE